MSAKQLLRANLQYSNYQHALVCILGELLLIIGLEKVKDRIVTLQAKITCQILILIKVFMPIMYLSVLRRVYPELCTVRSVSVCCIF